MLWWPVIGNKVSICTESNSLGKQNIRIYHGINCYQYCFVMIVVESLGDDKIERFSASWRNEACKTKRCLNLFLKIIKMGPLEKKSFNIMYAWYTCYSSQWRCIKPCFEMKIITQIDFIFQMKCSLPLSFSLIQCQANMIYRHDNIVDHFHYNN